MFAPQALNIKNILCIHIKEIMSHHLNPNYLNLWYTRSL